MPTMNWELNDTLKKRLMQLVIEGYKHLEILHVVSSEFEHYNWSPRTLRRRLKQFRIKQNDSSLTVAEVVSCIKEELSGAGRLLGIRSMHKKLRMVYGLRVKREQVILAMTFLDPVGLQRRRLVNNRKKFQRRVFTSKGPNWVWSLDGHDKLMGWHKFEFPLGIHGCVDTFSRKVIWLKAWPSNSSPTLPSRLYVNAVKENNVIPHFLRSDRGNENTTLFAVHNFFRGTPDGSSYIYGSSTTNQVIERWWRDLRERNGNYFRSALHSLTSTGLYDSGSETCRVILAILLIPVLQQELDMFRKCWNSHRIRRQNIRRPCGIPNFLYNYPENYGSKSEGYPVEEERITFIDRKLDLSTTMEFVPQMVQKSIREILAEANLFPVTLANFIRAYTVIYSGCKKRKLSLEFNRT